MLSPGAIQRTKASAMRYIALCALRRPRESSPIVYRRSLVTSRYSEPRSTLQKLSSACTIRSEEHTSELQSLMRISYAVFCLKKKKQNEKKQQQKDRRELSNSI